mmetsp:Transcript_57634/g.123921  ORF Transcript_57634/g.123921 Transcript_57634/m.123921 type:complete len:205 (+) Transcript_57634:79-693(+)|eukprot:CAMPEP_0204263188 /NCGR_PEP_ID=MMETSP0468-20130131/8184_1 /ASSEMBLY_ACC=CAM_ASM_000383 /TAXON_ID=2969 /ORGANISM="Oxyrrhis marina" /LENGTH=204 /DNA_ID=CAMNT_0051237941 /DNA_START=103 /DNA_END=717 /DNA_ORIENTATION=+
MRVIACLFAATVATTNQMVAQQWLQAHQDPSAGDLDELRQTNPMAFGIVAALLKKRSMGMPLSRFQATKPAQEAEPMSASSEDSEAGAAEVETAPRPHHIVDHFNWHPPSDEAAVQNALGAVASLAGGHSGFLSTKAAVAQEPAHADEVTPEEYNDKSEAPHPAAANAFSKYFGSSSKSALVSHHSETKKVESNDDNPYSKYLA